MWQRLAAGDEGSRIVTYEPDVRRRTPVWRSVVTMIGNTIRSRDLIVQLFVRDYLAAHKRSFLGVAWILISPLVAAVSWFFMSAAGVLRPGETGVPYPVYVLLGTTLWGLFMGVYQSSTATLTTAQSYILQVNYPHEVLLVKQALEQLSNFAAAVIVNLLVLTAFGIRPSWMIVLLPLMVLPLVLLAAGVGLMVSVLGVVANEVKRACDLGLGMLLFVTPVLYSATAARPAVRTLLRMNPLTHLIGAARGTVLFGQIPDPLAFALSALGALSVFVLAWRLFFLSENRVIEKLF
jgi:lipopolysaccharide transport system permease protein